MATETNSVKQAAEDHSGAEWTRSGVWYRPNVDIVEQGDDLLVLADVPGASNDDINVRFEDGTLSLHARVQPRGDDAGTQLVREYGVGDFYRTFQISEAIDASKITATCADGVLTLRLPKAEAVKPRKINVQGG